MNEAELKTKAIETAGWALDQIKNGSEWAIHTGTPEVGRFIGDLARQVVIYGAIKGWLLGVVCPIALLLLAKKSVKLTKSDSEGEEIFGTVGLVGGIMFAAMLACFHIETAIKATFAPKLYLVEQVAEMIK